MFKHPKFLLIGLAVGLLVSASAWADWFPGELISPDVEATYCLHVGPVAEPCPEEGGVKVSGHYTSVRASRNPAPTVGTCGTSPSVSATSTDTAGTITTGSTAVTACTLTFGKAYENAPVCVFTDANGSVTPVAYSTTTPTTTSVIVSFASATSKVINYVCVGK